MIYRAHTCRKVRGLGVDLVENKVAALQTNNTKENSHSFDRLFAGSTCVCVDMCARERARGVDGVFLWGGLLLLCV